jgi:hypothetical protein
MFAEHGYASHTPVSDGERVYVYFGKTGALAFDMDGNQLWQTAIGTESDPRGWGSAASPVLYQDVLIVNGSAESEALVGLDKKTGKQLWRQEAAGLSGVWATPVLVPINDQRTDLVIGVPNEIWGLNPLTGKLVWYCEGVPTDSVRASLAVKDDIVFFSEGRGGTVAVQAGGKGDVSATHVKWRTRDGGGIGTPILHDNKLYLFGNRMVRVVDVANGETLQQLRLQPGGGGGDRGPGGPGGPEAAGGPGGPDGPGGRGRRGNDDRGPGFGPPGGGPPADGLAQGPPPEGRGPGGPGGPEGPGGPGGPGGGRGGFGRGGGRRGGPGGGQDYASPVLAGDKIYITSRSGSIAVVQLGDELKLIGTNSLTADGGDFSATPAISDSQLVIRSTKYLYCIGK